MVAPAATAVSSPPRTPGEVDFTLTVPAIHYRATVLEGTTDGVLARAPGHYVTTAWPGATGNVGVAAHNTYWLDFGSLQVGDTVQVEADGNRYTYSITRIYVVNPDDRVVLAPTRDHRLTLTTCYPLWAGAAATQRLIFSAEQIDNLPVQP